MKKITGFSLILFLVMWLMPLDVVADNTGGDVNNDGEVNIADVNTVIDFILGSRSRQSIDVNGDGEINIADVNAVIGIILEGTSVSEEHEYVDLGLPSGTLWATCNVGADTPEDYGDYFAWGETESKDVYNWDTYKWCNGSEGTITKYCIDDNHGYNNFTDGKTELDFADDAAYVNFGTSWRMPTWEQACELVEYCSWTWTSKNGVHGQLGTGPNGNCIFLPAAGGRWNQSLYHVGSWGVYWSCTLSPSYSIGSTSNVACCLGFYKDDIHWFGNDYRFFGFSVRAVRILQN